MHSVVAASAFALALVTAVSSSASVGPPSSPVAPTSARRDDSIKIGLSSSSIARPAAEDAARSNKAIRSGAFANTADERRQDVVLQRAVLRANQTSAWAAVAMGAIGLLQLLLFGWQLWLIRRTVSDAAASASAARSAAEAASLNARAAVGIELPILTASVFGLLRTSKPFDPYDAPGGTVNDAYPGRYSGVGPITYKNNGRTPAFLDSIDLGWMVVDSLPSIPRYDVTVPLEHLAIIAPGEDFQVPYELLVELTEGQQQEVADNVAKLWVYGSLHYRDFLGEHREARFCCNYDHRPRGNVNPFGFVYDGRPPKAYVAPILHA